MLGLLASASLLTTATVIAKPTGDTAFRSNLAYRSPSLTVDALAIDLSHVRMRLGKRFDNVLHGKSEI